MVVANTQRDVRSPRRHVADRRVGDDDAGLNRVEPVDRHSRRTAATPCAASPARLTPIAADRTHILVLVGKSHWTRVPHNRCSLLGWNDGPALGQRARANQGISRRLRVERFTRHPHLAAYCRIAHEEPAILLSYDRGEMIEPQVHDRRDDGRGFLISLRRLEWKS